MRAFGVDFDVEHVDTGEALEQHALAFHNRLGSQWTEVAQTENRGTVGNDSDQIALTGIAVSQLRITGDFPHRLGNTRAVGQRQITGSGSGLGQLDAQLTRTGFGVIFESGSFQIRHRGISAFWLLNRQAAEDTQVVYICTRPLSLATNARP
ncbi:hypothetical protein D3C80_1252190 [compost metagenome]